MCRRALDWKASRRLGASCATSSTLVADMPTARAMAAWSIGGSSNHHCMEAGMISPPFGINIFIIKSLDPDMPLSTVFRGCWPFFASAVVKIVQLLAFPVLVTCLPSMM